MRLGPDFIVLECFYLIESVDVPSCVDCDVID